MSKLLAIRKEGGSRVIAVTRILPPDWVYVEVQELKKNKETITLKIIKVG